MSSDGLERLAQCSRALVALSEDLGGFPAPTPTLSPVPGFTTPSSEAPRTHMVYIFICKQDILYIKKRTGKEISSIFRCPTFIIVALINILTESNLWRKGFIQLTIPTYSPPMKGRQSKNSSVLGVPRAFGCLCMLATEPVSPAIAASSLNPKPSLQLTF